MPDVGVLNLTIRDNASEAAKGLGQLEKKLAGVKAAAEGYDLSTVSTQISNLISTAKGSEKATAALGTLMNAVSDYHKTFAKLGNVELNLTPIEKIKSALEGGINIGNAGTQINKIREAMSGEWNTANAESASTVLSTIATGAKELIGAGLNTAAKNISALAKSIGDVSIAIGGMQASGLSGFAGLMSGGIGEANSTGASVALGVKEGIESERDALINSAIQMAVGAVMAMKQALDIHSPSGVTEGEVGTPMGQGVVEGLMQTESTIKNAAVEVVQNAVSAMRSEVEQSTIDLSKIPAMSANGGFANIAEEIKFVSAELDKSRENIKFWSDTYDSTMRGIKYAGATEDRTNMLGHAEEGFYQAVEQAETYEAALNAINGYVQAYIKNEQNAVKATNEHADSIKQIASIAPLYEQFKDILSGKMGDAAQGKMLLQIQNATGINMDEIMRQITELSGGTVIFKKMMDDIASSTESNMQRVKESTQTNMQQTETAVSEGVERTKSSIDSLKEAIRSATTSDAKMTATDHFIQEYSHIDYLKNKIVELKGELASKIQIGLISDDDIDKMISKINKLQAELDKLTQTSTIDIEGEYEKFANALNEVADAEENAKESSFSLSLSLGDLKAGIQGMFPTITNLIKRFAGMAKMRAMRYVIRQIAAGFKEGIQNVYEYSKAINGSFAPSMDSAASSLAQMKNSLGAALVPLLQSIIPILNTVINWFITAINYVNQFFALLRGQSTWTRATPQTVTAFKNQEKAAKGAGSAMKDLLADWDELNIIQSQGGGGGGGGSNKAAEDYLNMFEEVDIFNDKLKKITDFIKDNMEDVLSLVKKAGAALLLWKFSKAFTGLLGKLSSLAVAALVIDISWKLTEMFDNQYLKDHDEGWLIADAITNLVGATLAGAIVGKVLGGAVGFITAGIELVVSGGITYGIARVNASEDDKQVLDKLAAIKTGIGTAAMAIGFGILSGSVLTGTALTIGVAPLMFVLGAGVTMVLEQAKTAQEIANEAFTQEHEGGISIDELFKALNAKFKEASEGYKLVIDAYADVPTLKTDLADALTNINNLTAVITSDQALTQEEADKFSKAWSTVFDTFKGVTEKSFDTVFTALNESLTAQNKEIREQAKELRISLLMAKDLLSNVEAEFQVEMEDLVDKIVSGKATNEDKALYEKYVTAMSQTTDNAMKPIEEIIEEATRINIKDLDEVKDFLEKATAQEQESLKTVDEGRKAALSGIEDMRSSTKTYYEMGKINDTQYNDLMTLYDSLEDNINKAADERQETISKALVDTYNTLLSSALKDLDTIKRNKDGSVNLFAAWEYMLTDVDPIVKAIIDAGGKVDDALIEAFGVGATPEEYFGKGFADSPMVEWLKKYYGIDDTVETVAEIVPEPVIEEPTKEEYLENATQTLQKYADEHPMLVEEKIDEAVSEAVETLETMDETIQDTASSVESVNSAIEGTADAFDKPLQKVDELKEKIDELDKYINDPYRQLYTKLFSPENGIDTSKALDYYSQIIELKNHGDTEALQAILDYVNQYGIEGGFETWNKYGNGVGKYNTKGMIAGGVTLNGMGTGDWAGQMYVTPVQPENNEPTDVRDLSGDVANGMREGNQNIADALQTAISYLMRIAAKDLSVTFSPTIAAGGWVGASQGMLNKITGD